MSRIRSIHPRFFSDDRLVSTSMAARLLFLGLGVEADDKGIFEWKPLTIRMRVFPGDSVDVAALLAELVAADAILAYEIDGRQYGAIRNFRKFQRPKSPNDLYPSTADIRNYIGLTDDIPPIATAQVHQFPPKGEKRLQMEDGGDKREDGKKEGKPEIDISGALSEYSELASRKGLSAVRDLTPTRRKKLSALLKNHGIEKWSEALAIVERTPFLVGENNRGWRANLDFLLQPGSFAKVLEGQYGLKNGASAGTATELTLALRDKHGNTPDSPWYGVDY